MSNEDVWKKRFERERKRRTQSESLLEEKSRELYEAQLELEKKLLEIEQTNKELNDSFAKLAMAEEELRQNAEELQVINESLEERIEERVKELREHKRLIEKKNHDITQSLNYALRIQKAMLHPEEELQKFFPNAFIFFKPKDIVSGDFYWFTKKDQFFDNCSSGLYRAWCTRCFYVHDWK